MRRARQSVVLLLCAALGAGCANAASQAGAMRGPTRVGLKAGWTDAGQAAWNLALVAHREKPQGFSDPNDLGSFSFVNSDLAFQGNLLFQGGYNGFQVWDISNPAAPTLRIANACAGGQGDVSVYGNLLFVSVEETRARLDCTAQGVPDSVSADRFRGVRIFDISNVSQPRIVAQVQTCRGSHTHTLVEDPADRDNVYVYVSGTGPVRSSEELAGCSGLPPEQDPNTSLFRIDVIQVPLAAPQNARIVSSPRVFAENGRIAGLWRGGAHGPNTQETSETSRCHDITVYEAIGLAAGACSGNGILLDIRNPADPHRIDAVSDPNFAFWHSASFNNSGTKVVFTDEWGGGRMPRCRESDRPEWGADAIFTLENGKLNLASYYKIPDPQTETENCVAHNGSLIPVPGRDIMVQAWYQGGISVFDFTDAAHPQEIAYFDRGPLSATELILGGFWSAYWYNGMIYGSEIGRGLDVFELKPSAFLTQNEIDAARQVRFERLNVQDQPRISWEPSFAVARAYLDQIERGSGLSADLMSDVRAGLNQAEKMTGSERTEALTVLAGRLEREAPGSGEEARLRRVAEVLRAMR